MDQQARSRDKGLTWMSRLRAGVRRESEAYAPDRSLAGYAGAMVAFGTYCAALAAASRRAGREEPSRIHPQDLAVGAVAVFRLSRLAAKNTVTSPLRAPFTEYRGHQGPAENAEEPRGTGVRRTVGELVTCPFCLSVWVAATYIGGLMVVPRATRLSASSLAVLAGADALQFVYSALMRLADEDTPKS
jgi:hypothetical protein